METVELCPLCGNDTFSPYLICKDFLVSNQEFSIQQCQKCNFRLTNPRPDVNSINSYYKSEQYISHNDQSDGLVNTVYRFVRSYTLRTKVNLITRVNRGEGKVLDVGCGTGAFLEQCHKSGWQTMGTEPDAEARKVANKKLKIEIQSSLTDLSNSQPFNIITLWHVLEHISNLNEIIPKLNNLLSNEGTLLIAVPNSNSHDAHYFKQYWAAYDVPRHLNHFTPSTIEPLFTRHGFSLVKKIPMMFDAYYISLLSTQYQTGTTDYLASLKVGLASNTKAKRTGEFSSLIYLFRKS